MVVIFSFDIRGQLLVYVLKVLFAQSDHDCSSQWCMDRIVMYMAENRSLTMTLCGVQGYGNHNANISMGDILGLWKSLRDHYIIPCRNNFCLPKNWFDVNNSEFGERAPNFTKDSFH